MFEFVGRCLRIRNLVQFFLYCIAYYCTSIPVGQEKKKKKKNLADFLVKWIILQIKILKICKTGYNLNYFRDSGT